MALFEENMILRLRVRFWGQSGQSWILACDGLSANDPKGTCDAASRSGLAKTGGEDTASRR
jgi:hypothetical protein